MPWESSDRLPEFAVMRALIMSFIFTLFAACSPRQRVEMVNPGFPGKVDTVEVKKVIRPHPPAPSPVERGRN